MLQTGKRTLGTLLEIVNLLRKEEMSGITTFPSRSHSVEPPTLQYVGKHFTFKYGKSSFRARVLWNRAMVSRGIFEPETEPSWKEIGQFIDNCEFLCERLAKDPQAAKKYNPEMTLWRTFMSVVTKRTLPKVTQVLKNLAGFLHVADRYSASSFYGNYRSVLQALKLKRINRLLERKAVSPKRVVGVGYNDHGNRKEVALDGSPSWQEVASSGRSTEDLLTLWKQSDRLFSSHLQPYCFWSRERLPTF